MDVCSERAKINDDTNVDLGCCAECWFRVLQLRGGDVQESFPRDSDLPKCCVLITTASYSSSSLFLWKCMESHSTSEEHLLFQLNFHKAERESDQRDSCLEANLTPKLVINFPLLLVSLYTAASPAHSQNIKVWLTHVPGAGAWRTHQVLLSSASSTWSRYHFSHGEYADGASSWKLMRLFFS